MTKITKTCIHICEIDSEHQSQKNTSSCDVGRYPGPKVNNCFFDFDSVNDEIPAGSRIDSATLKLAQVSGGYSDEIDIDITLRSGNWVSGGFTWDSQPVNTAAGTANASLSGTGAGTRSFAVTSLIQWIIDNNSSAHIFKLARDPNDTTGDNNAKRFSTTPSKHSLEINYTAPTAPTAPTGLSSSPNPFEGALRVSWTPGTNGILNPITGQELRYQISDDGINWSAETVVSLSAAATYYDIPASTIAAWTRGKYFRVKVGSKSAYASTVYSAYTTTTCRKNRAPNSPTGASVPKSSYVPGETIRISFTNTGDPDNNLAGFELAMKDENNNWYGPPENPTIVGQNPSGTASFVDINTAGWSQGEQWKFYVRGYDALGVRGAWSAPTALVTMNADPNAPVFNYPAAGSTVYNPRPHMLITAGQTNDGPKHILRMNDGTYKTTVDNGALFSCGTTDNLGSNQKVVYINDLGYAGVVNFGASMHDGFLTSPEVYRSFTISSFTPSDPDLSIPGMKIKAVHITDLRSAIDNLRVAYGLPAAAWIPMVAGVTLIGNAAIITELQTALQAVIDQINNWDSNNNTFNIDVVWINPAAEGGGVDRIKLRQAIEQLRSLITSI